MAMNFDELRAASNAARATIEVECKELGGTVRLQKLGAAAAIALGKKLNGIPKDEAGVPLNADDLVDAYASLLANSIVEDDGQSLLAKHGEPARDVLKGLPLPALTQLAGEAMQLNGLAGSKDSEGKSGAKSIALETALGE